MDENNIPEKLIWSAPDGSIKNNEAKALFLSLWDSNKQEAFKIDLWVKDMPVDQMQMFFYQTLLEMSETFYKATNDKKMTETMKDFCEYFAEKLKIIKK